MVTGSLPLFQMCDGGVLLSHTPSSAVPSALAGLATGFGMGTGRFPATMTTVKMVDVTHTCFLCVGVKNRIVDANTLVTQEMFHVF